MKPVKIFCQIICFSFLFLLGNKAFAADLQIDSSIKPIFSLVSMVTSGVSNPVLVIYDNRTPHDIILSETARLMVMHSKILFIDSRYLEASIYSNVMRPGKTKLIEVANFNDLTKLPFNSDRLLFTSHDAERYTGNKNSIDYHVWLDPQNAKKILVDIANVLSKYDPAHERRYMENAVQYGKEIAIQDALLSRQLAPHGNTAFLFYHNAFTYFANRYKLHTTYAIQSGARAVAQDISNPNMPQDTTAIIQFAKLHNVPCVFLEPQFPNPSLKQALEHNGIKVVYIDPVGYNLPNNKDLYFKLLNNIMDSFSQCVNK